MVLVAVLALGGCAARTPPPSPSPVANGPQPPDGRWLTDEQGRQYFLRPIPKAEGVRIDARTVRTIWRVPLDVVSEDDRFYYYKFYRAPAAAAPAPTPIVPPIGVELADPPSSARLSFHSFGTGLPTAGQWRDGFALADMNGDGQLDIVHGPPRKGAGRPVVFLGDGRGGWRGWDEADFPPLPFDYGDAQAADLDGDGRVDLALAVHLRGVVVLAGDGHGGFREAGRGVDFACDGGVAPFSSRALRVADIDRDGRPDIVALGDGPRLTGSPGADATGVVVYSNRGGGAWRPSPSRAAPGLFGGSLALGDFDGDGRQDLATASAVLGRRDIVQLARPDGAWEPVTLAALPPQAFVRAVAAGDVDDDGRVDLAVAFSAFDGAGWRSGIRLMRPEGSGWRSQPLAGWAGAAGSSALALGDVDGDGRRDVVALTASGETWVFLADGSGSFTREHGPPPYGPGCRGSHVEVADLDGDGSGEIVATFAHEPQPAVCPSGGGVVVWKAVLS